MAWVWLRTPSRASLIVQLLAAGLDGEVFLGLRNFGLARVAVLGDEVAGKTGKVVIIELSLAAGAQVDHFAGAGKMVFRVIARGLARDHRPFNGLGEAPPLGIAELELKVAGAPEFGSVLVGLLD
jgi:hypothetical protein